MNQQLAKDIWSEELEIEYADTGKSYGNYTIGDNKIILSENLLGGGKEGSAKLASVMSHEGTHYNGNRIEGIANISAADTYSQLNQNFNLQADTSFSLEMLAGIINADNWTENTGDVDYWKFVQKDDGSFGWNWDNDYEFNIGDKTITAEEMKGIIASQKVLKNKALLTGLGLEKLYSKEDKTTFFTSLTPSESTQAQNEMFMSFIKTEGIDGIKAYEEFLANTESFADASISAEILKEAIKEGNSKEVNYYLNQMNSALYVAQDSGLLMNKQAGIIDTADLIGTGTTASPYFPLAGIIDENNKPYAKITSYEGWRIVDKEMSAIPSGSYKLNEFSPFYHKGWDGLGSGNIIASLKGEMYLDYLNAEGFQVNNTTALGIFNTSHASANTIDQYFNLFGQEGINMTCRNGTYLLNGIQAGEVIGYIGNTGTNTTGAHAHMSLNGNGDLFANVFNQGYYYSFDYKLFQPDSYASYMSGYKSTNLYNHNLWENVQEKIKNYSSATPSLFDYQLFMKKHEDEYIYNFWSKYR